LSFIGPVDDENLKLNIKFSNHGEKTLVFHLPENESQLKYFQGVLVLVDNVKAEHIVGSKAIAIDHPVHSRHVELRPNESLDYVVDLAHVFRIGKDWKRLEVKPTVVDAQGDVAFVRGSVIIEQGDAHRRRGEKQPALAQGKTPLEAPPVSDAARPAIPARRKSVREQNPGYRERAGTSYENTALPGSTASLAKAVNHPRLPEGMAREILKEFIYNYLDLYLDRNGALTRAEQARLLEQVDQRVRDTVGDEAAFQRYLTWRKESGREENPLEFLFRKAIPITVELPKDLSAAGWTLQSLVDLEQPKRYQAYFDLAPDQVLIFENQKIGRKGDGPEEADWVPARVTLLVYPKRRVLDLWDERELKGRPTPAQVGAEGLPPIQLFWQTENYVLFVAETPFHAEQSKVMAVVKQQLFGR
jgi:hypothetical protein